MFQIKNKMTLHDSQIFALQHRCTNITHDSHQRITTLFLGNGQILVKIVFFCGTKSMANCTKRTQIIKFQSIQTETKIPFY